MGWETALRARLLADATVAGLVGVRVDWTVSSAMTLPRVVLTLVSDPRPQTLKSCQSGRASLVQIDVLAADWSQLVTLREAVIAAVTGPFEHGGVQFGRTQFNSVTGGGASSGSGFVHKARIDASLFHE